MFPTLGLFASVRCPDLSASGGGTGSCKRNPCLFSHIAPPPRLFTIRKRPPASRDGLQTGHERPVKTTKVSSNGKSALFQSSQRDPEDVAANAENNVIAASTSTVSSTVPVGPLRNTTFRKPAIEITGSGQVIRKQVVPTRKLASTATSTSHATQQPSSTIAFSSKGKERATDINGSTTATSTLPTMSNSREPPRLPLMTRNSYFPMATRNTMLKSMYHEFIHLYRSLSPHQLARRLASEHATAQELSIYTKNNKVILPYHL